MDASFPEVRSLGIFPPFLYSLSLFRRIILSSDCILLSARARGPNVLRYCGPRSSFSRLLLRLALFLSRPSPLSLFRSSLASCKLQIPFFDLTIHCLDAFFRDLSAHSLESLQLFHLLVAFTFSLIQVSPVVRAQLLSCDDSPSSSLPFFPTPAWLPVEDVLPSSFCSLRRRDPIELLP